MTIESMTMPTSSEMIPWVPLRDGIAFKPLRFTKSEKSWALLLKLEPGAVIARHRHTGEVHAFNLQGSRELDTKEVLGPGAYAYEPAGNVDSWRQVGDEPLVVMVVVTGAIEYLGPDGEVLHRSTPSSQRDLYRRYCTERGLPYVDLSA